MVQLMSSGKKSAVKLELHDSLEDQLGPLKKRSKLKEVWINKYFINFRN